MMTLAITFFLLGATLGIRYIFLILFPVAAIIVTTGAVVLVVTWPNPWPAAYGVLLSLSALQIGYLMGAAIRPIVAPSPALEASAVQSNMISPPAFGNADSIPD